ncbi:hypothetical protein [Paucibacter sp. Y2R2-4]|uniref:hypothetical protein n=1 Tax=Paucibacter sp. Y2R2-4 TaxID=2893553 RepID=UPI0021E3A679|nr:hypothetical protein [Paucibacter sp. Y2R2-4]MCV2349125.1 hypothetical protein [Paucibacter sp. Y2R2-4]
MQAASFTSSTNTHFGAQPQGAAAVRALRQAHVVQAHLVQAHLELVAMMAAHEELAPGPQRHT